MGRLFELTYLPKIGMQIGRAKRMFQDCDQKEPRQYDGNYYYCYCTQKFSLLLYNGGDPEARCTYRNLFAYDIDIINKLYRKEEDHEGYIHNLQRL